MKAPGAADRELEIGGDGVVVGLEVRNGGDAQSIDGSDQAIDGGLARGIGKRTGVDGGQ